MKGLYIHIPFCKSKCPYCDFYSAGYSQDLSGRYCYALADEMKRGVRTKAFTTGEKMSFDTIYLGGGTPSIIGGKAIGEIVTEARNNYNITDDAEVTVECNPSTVDDEFFKIVADYGVNRISLGLQSAVDMERKALGRIADRYTVGNCIEKAEKYGIHNISLDIMLGIPKQTMDSLDDTIDFCLSTGVPHISAYMLTIEERTPFFKLKEKLQLPDEDDVCEMYLHLITKMEENGIMQYEISNFAKPGCESRHNMKYWRCEEYLGLGPAAHSFINGNRFFFKRSTDSFISGDEALFDSIGGDEKEYIMLALRLSEGIKEKAFSERFKKPIPCCINNSALSFAEKGLVYLDNNGIKLTKKGFLLSNYVISELLDY